VIGDAVAAGASAADAAAELPDTTGYITQHVITTMTNVQPTMMMMKVP